MRGRTPPAPSQVLDRLREEHERLGALLDGFVGFVSSAGSEPDDAAPLWAPCEAELLAHMDGQERSLLPVLQRTSARSARVLVQEHRYIRARIAEIRRDVDAGTLRIDVARAFAFEVMAHARSEERLLEHALSVHPDQPGEAPPDAPTPSGRGALRGPR